MATTSRAAGLFLVGLTMTGKIALIPAENAWCFSTNLFGATPTDAIELLNGLCELESKLETIYLTGVTPLLKNALLQGQNITHSFRVIESGQIKSVIANIENGTEGIIKRVSANKRKNLKRTLKFRSQLNFDYIRATDTPELVWERLLAVEKQSWKWQSFQSIFQKERHAVFYKELFDRFNAKGQAHILFVQYRGEDIAYIFGASEFQVFRGFQTSFIEREDVRKMSAGNNGHLYLMNLLSQQGYQSYNFGSVMDYKLSWGKPTIATENLELVVNNQ